MPVIRVRFITEKSFVSAAIRGVTGSLFSHTEFGTPEGTWIGAHAGSGVEERPADYCVCSLEYVYEVPCTQEQLDTLLAWARGQIGTKYNYLDIVGLLVKKRKWTSPHRLICSQFVSNGMLLIFGAARYLNVLSTDAATALTTPEMDHLSPIFVGHRVKEFCLI